MQHLWVFASDESARILDSALGSIYQIWHCPALPVEPINPPNIHPQKIDEVIFISANAIKYGVPIFQQHFLAMNPHPRAWVMGAMTQNQLEGIFPTINIPKTGNDSEALLAEPAFASAHRNTRTVLIFKGEGGREILAPTLRARGAQVIEIAVYRRLSSPYLIDIVRQRWAQNAAPEGLIVLSNLALSTLHSMLALIPARNDTLLRLRDCPLFVHHWKIRDQAIEWGFTQVYAQRGLQALITALRQRTP